MGESFGKGHAGRADCNRSGMNDQVPPISVVVLTLNERGNIAACLESCRWSDDVHVLDSGSTDGTVEIAKAMGVQVHYNKFESFGQQRNWAIDHVPCKHKWHFHLDADERFTQEQVAEMLREIGPDGSRSAKAGYLCPSKMIFLGHWLKYSGNYPSYQVRLFHKDRCRFMDFGHGQRENTTGEIGTFKEPYDHFNFSKGLGEWLAKHNGYSDRESAQAVSVRTHGRPSIGQLRAMDPVDRRRAMKNLSYFLPLRGMFRFLYLYLWKFGILDGTAGLRYSALVSMYEYWIELKTDEREKPWNPRTLSLADRMMEERR